MENNEVYLSEIKQIRKMMEQSSRFLSLSGLSGILIGVYALIGAFITHRWIYFSPQSFYRKVFLDEIMERLIFLAAIVLIMSLCTAFWLSYRKAAKSGKKFWSAGSRLMCLNLAIPLVSGGILILIFASRGIFSIIAPSCLVFYGLALVNASKFTRQEIFYVGLLQIILGIFAAILPGMGLFFWAMGFGIIHIIYGAIMYFRYERDTADKLKVKAQKPR